MSKSSLSTSFETLLNSLQTEEVKLSNALVVVGDKGFGLLLCILSLPSALPVPAPGYSTPFGILLMFMAYQMIRGRSRPHLPRRAENLTLKRKFATRLFTAAIKFLHYVEFLIKPRMKWIGSSFGLRFMGVVVFLMAFLMTLPIPFTNTAPAMVIFLIGIGLCEEDGFFAGIAGLLGVLATALYVFIVYFFITLLTQYEWSQASEALKETIKSFFR